MNKTTKVICSLLAAAGLMSTAACSSIADPDAVGLFYEKGTSDGYKFLKCVEPGGTGPATTDFFGDEDELIQLPTSLRTWTIDGIFVNGAWVPAPGADSGEEIVVSAKPEENQPSGVQVRVATKTSFNLNTYCGSDGGAARQFWEKVGRRYYVVDPANWWRNMLNAELVPTQKTIIRDVIRGYNADQFIANVNNVQADAQKLIAERLAVEFNRVAGGNFFCGPSFNRAKEACPALELLIIGAEYADAGIQAARNEKVKAIELAAAALEKAKGEAAALVAEAEGKRDAAAKVAALYNSPGWVSIQLQIMQLEAVKACGANPNCHMFVGNSGAQIFSTR